MFIGHFGVAFAAKKLAPKTSLGTLFIAAQWLDLLWPTLLLLDLEHAQITHAPQAPIPLVFTDYPLSHSLLAVIGWAALFGLAAYALRRDRRAALVIGALVLSHWVLDWLVHVPDLPLMPGGSLRVGLGLWRSLPWSMALEAAIFAGGVALYASATKALDRTGRWALSGLVAFLAVVHAANRFGPPPPSIAAVAWSGEPQWLFVLWAWWLDKHRAGAA